MKLKDINNIYFLGIGGIGMSAIARYFLYLEKKVCGYDLTASDLTNQLQREGASIHFEDQIALLPSEIDLVIYTPAIPNDNALFNEVKRLGLPMMKRSEALGLISANSYSIGIAGTHGKTTTSCLLTHILKSSEKDCSAFLGGIATNYNTNAVFAEKGDNMVLEADEFDRSFLKLSPAIGLVTSTDADHLDIYGDQVSIGKAFNEYVRKIVDGGILVHHVNADLDLPSHTKNISYGLEGEGEVSAVNIEVRDGGYHFDVKTPTGVIEQVTVGLPGRHNVENAIGALAIAMEMGVPVSSIKEALSSFSGIKRRFEQVYKDEHVVYIDDYAHHPTELAACIESVKELYPHKKITGIFQPHLYSRTRDFADDFAKSLSKLNELILLEIYPAREKAIPGVTSNMLLHKVALENKIVVKDDQVIEELDKRQVEVLLTLGAGSIGTLVAPIKERLSKLN